MNVETRCSNCRATFRVPATGVGKRTVCPKCSKSFVIAAIIAAPAGASSIVTPKAEQWRAKSPDGSEFGPIEKQELDAWAKEGRINSQFHVLRVGDAQWQWATDIYPELEATSTDPFALAHSPSAPEAGTEIAAGPMKHRALFRPRQYPAMTVVMWVCYILAGLFALSLVISMVIIVMGTSVAVAQATKRSEILASMRESNEYADTTGHSAIIAAAVMASATTILAHGIGILICVYAAETVKVILDIQRNTQESAHFTRMATES